MRVFNNEDWTHYLWSRENQKISDKDLKNFIYQYKDTTVTDFVFNVNGTVSSSPSKILETWVDKYNAREENGVSVDYTKTYASLAYDLFVRQGLNMYTIWIETCKEIGINPWLSIRMNDVHFNISETELRKSVQVEKYAEHWISAHRKAKGWFCKALDYSKQFTRERMLAYITEQVKQYDVFGVELDFTREPFCFPCGKEEDGQKIIFDFVKEVRRILDEVGSQRGRRIALSILGQANPISALKTGFDIAEIAQAGLIDLYVASPRWETVNTDIPIEIWKKLLPKKVAFGCSQGLLVRGSRQEEPKIGDVAIDMGQAAANVSRGCDIIYLFNHFDTLEDGLQAFTHENHFRRLDNIRYIYKNIGKINESESWERRIPVTYDDFVAFSEPVATKLPITCTLEAFRLPCGRMETEREIYIHVVLKEETNPENIRVYVNTKKAEYQSDNEKIVWANGKVYTFAISLKTDKILGVEIESDLPITISYVDALIPASK
ncbi:MAG: hypothetical protein J6Q32_02545 [Clostridia bacterium]|nr:hypothetical protein [Clostridia bacterium]